MLYLNRGSVVSVLNLKPYEPSLNKGVKKLATAKFVEIGKSTCLITGYVQIFALICFSRKIGSKVFNSNICKN